MSASSLEAKYLAEPACACAPGSFTPGPAGPPRTSPYISWNRPIRVESGLRGVLLQEVCLVSAWRFHPWVVIWVGCLPGWALQASTHLFGGILRKHSRKKATFRENQGAKTVGRGKGRGCSKGDLNLQGPANKQVFEASRVDC